MIICNTFKSHGWVFYCRSDTVPTDYKSGKWMYFFNDSTFVAGICAKAVESGIVVDAKHTDADEGVACFYIDVDDLLAHKRVINFFLENGLIRKSSKTGKLYNISFKRDFETFSGQYTSFGSFSTELKLDRFIDLKTGQWIIDDIAFAKLIPPEVKLLSKAEDFEIDKSIFGVNSAFKYVILAFPTCIPMCEPYQSGRIHFWRGKIPKKLLSENSFYIITFKAVFYLKSGKTPFVKCKTSLMYGFKPLKSSDVYDPTTKKWYDSYIDFNGKETESFPTFTLSKQDYHLFKETYDIVKLKELGGCYFE
jgi:hypothetical protein